MSYKRALMAVLLSSGSALAATGAMAQAAPQAAEPASDTSQVGEVIVTAQKRNERIQDVPISITVVSGDQVNRAGAKNITELQGVTPGLFASGNSGYAGAPISIRGTAGTNATLLDDPVAVYVNGVYQPSGTFGTTALLDIGSIQVVRGPQGTLQGRNATAGAVLIETANPGASVDGFLRTSYADPSEFRAEGAIGGPLSDTLRARIAVGYYDERGWATNTFNGSHIGGGRGFSARGTIRWWPTENLDVRLVVGHIYTYAEPALARYAATPFNPAPGGPLILAGTATPTTPLSPSELSALQDDRYALNRPTFNKTTDDSVVLNATYNFGGVDLVSVTGYDRVNLVGAADSDGLARTDREGFNTGNLPARYFSQEVRLQSRGASRFSWILGAYYSDAIQDMDFNIDNLQLTVADRRTTRFVAHQDTKSYAGFADATFHVTPEIALIGGVRYTRETKDFAFDRTIVNFDTGATLAPLFQYRPAQAVFDNTSYRVKATWQPTPDLLLYVSYSTGFKSGGFNAFGADPAFNPEKLKSAEVGIKADLLDKRLSLALAAYSNNYDELQVRVGVPAGGIAITNAADSKIDGFELEGTFRPIPEWTFTGNVANTNARFSSFPLARNLLDQGPFDASGNKLPRTPEWQYFAQASYAPRLTENVSGLFELSYRWHSRIFLYQTDQTSSTVQGDAVGELGARAGITLQPSQVSITVFGTNLTNERAVNNANITFSYPEVSFNKPRTVGIQLEVKF